MHLQMLEDDALPAEHRASVPHQWAIEPPARFNSSRAIKDGELTAFVALPVPVAGPQATMHAAMQWASTPGRRVLLVCGILGALALPMLAVAGLGSVPNPCSSALGGLGLISGNARQAQRAMLAARFRGMVVGGS